MLQVLFPNESVSTILARMIGTIGPIDMQMLALGQETPKYFTEEYDLFHKNEVHACLHFSVCACLFKYHKFPSHILPSVFKKTNIILLPFSSLCLMAMCMT